MSQWFEQTVLGGYVAEKERRFFAAHAPGRVQTAVQIGAPWLMPSENLIRVPENVRMNADAMAWESRSLDVLLMPHSHEYCANPLIALAEATRVLKPEGRLVVSGFNPNSLWGGSRLFDGKCLPEKQNRLSLPEFKRQTAALGFEVEYGKFMVYVPPVESLNSLKFWQFLEKAGDRWWPQCAAVYGLVLIKRVAGVRPLPEVEAALKESGNPVVLGAARMGKRAD
ncbi:class I SAM-dependent methyltransferase [Neisseria chenwenguii]|uniref:Methyltransferase n=1 Tax=Neisseria chenwenguii TaxID=1853278 RepID=A0A220RZU8_9NEIS|nr:methyltransferase domain-containing protein [Neisseria chenwenguii]ASK26717.1 methyltransferase [Neisseria chenwenguii]ROV56379.1 methyltransferase domain-containing protein [Neisseria chenwenguii]